MRSFGSAASRVNVSAASSPLRSRLRPGHRKRFFATLYQSEVQKVKRFGWLLIAMGSELAETDVDGEVFAISGQFLDGTDDGAWQANLPRWDEVFAESRRKK